MADLSEVVPRTESDSEEADAAIHAFVRFTQSAKDFLGYERICAEGLQANKALSLKEAEVKEKDGTIKELKSVIAVWHRQGHEEVTRMELQKKEVAKEKSDLDTQLRQAQADKEELRTRAERVGQLLDGKTQEIARLQKEVLALKGREAELKTALSKETTAKDNSAKEIRAARAQLGEYDSYTANLDYFDLSKFSKDVEKIWESTNALVERYFSSNVSTELFKEHEKWAQYVYNVIRPSGSIRIPPTNTAAAKFARKAVMLNMFAVLFTQWIFTATPLSLARAGLDVILSELLEQDERKELLCRAILLSVRSGNPEEDRERQQVAKSVTEPAGVLFPSNARTEMKSDVKSLVAEASHCWAASRRSPRKLIATLDYETYPDSWADYPAPSHQRRRDAQNTEASDPEDEEEVAYVAFPAIIARSGATWKTIFRGLLIRYSHLQKAKDEWRKEMRTRRNSRTGVPH